MRRSLFLLSLGLLAGCPGGGDTDSDTPTDAPPSRNAVSIAAGEQHSLIVTEDGEVYATGNNSSGVLCMDESTGGIEAFTLVEALSGIASVEAGSITSFFVADDGTLMACGHNGDGALGIDDDSVTYQYAPATVQLGQVDQVRSGGGHSFALDAAGDLFGFGNNVSGEVGIGTTGSDQHAPAGLATLHGLEIADFDAASGGGFSVAVLEDGTVYTWGNNLSGELGDGGAGPNAVNPGVLSTVDAVTQIAAGGGHTIALKDDGTVWGWGTNGSGQAGTGATSTVETPAQIAGLTGIVAVDAGNSYSIALDDAGAVWFWGNNSTGASGQGPSGDATYTTPVQVSGIPVMTRIVAGSSHVLALSEEGEVWGWGLVDAAQLGNGISDYQYEPIRVF